MTSFHVTLVSHKLVITFETSSMLTRTCLVESLSLNVTECGCLSESKSIVKPYGIEISSVRA
jgi:hypothetical protein